MSDGHGFYRIILLMVKEDFILKRVCPPCDDDPQKVMDFLQGLPHEQRMAFVKRNAQHFRERSILSRLARAIQRGAQDGLEGTFYRMADWWILGTAFHSSAGPIKTYPGYRQIVDLGMPVVPLILAELQIDPNDNWLYILEEIVGENSPVIPEEIRDKFQPRIDIWLEWGRSRELIQEEIHS